MKDNTKMNRKDWIICLLIFSITIPSMLYIERNNQQRLFEVTIKDSKYNLYNQSGECLYMVSKDSLDKVLMYEYQIGK